MKGVFTKPYYIISLLALGGVAFAAVNFSNPPLFSDLDQFVLFVQEEIKLEKEVQVSSGDLGSNNQLDIQKDAVINGNLFADEITLDKNTTINGNVSFNKLKTEKEAKILGTQTKPVQLPIANLPEIPDFQVGTQDFKFEGENNTLVAGNYRDITLEKGSRLILNGGVYNLRKLELKENSILIFNAPATLNIQQKLKGQQKVAILPGANLKPDDLKINYQGKKEKGDKDLDDTDDDKNAHPVQFGNNSFLNLKLLAPQARVHIGESSTLRGQILAKKVSIGKDSVLSRDVAVASQPRIENIVSTPEGGKIVINQIILQLTSGSAFSDASAIASLVNGRIVGIIVSINLYQIELSTKTVDELDSVIQQIKSSQNPKIKNVSKNNILNLIQ